MTRWILITILTLISSLGFTEDIYLYPGTLEINSDCEMAGDEIEKIEEGYSEPGIGHSGIARAFPVDLNGDSVCEIFLDNPSFYEGNGNSFTTVLVKVHEVYKSSGDLSGNPERWWYGELKNGYPRIIVPTYTGHRTNPVYVTDVYYFDGKKYVLEFDSGYSHGYLSDLGLKSYKKKDYYSSEKWYLNAYRMKKNKSMADANNLALSYIRQGKCEMAVELLENHLKIGTANERQEKSARFNIGLCKS